MKLVKTDNIISNYKEKSDALIRRMFQILVKAQKKVDEGSYKRLSGVLKNKDI
jgi:hypothetical protein